METCRDQLAYDVSGNGRLQQTSVPAGSSRRARLVAMLLSTSLVVIVPTGLVLLAEPSLRDSAGIGWILAVVALTTACVRTGVRVSRSELQPLGAWVGALRGALAGFVVASAFAFWASSFPLSIGSLLLITVAVFTVDTLAQSLAQRYVKVPRRVLVVGSSGPVGEMLIELKRTRSTFHVIGRVDDDGAWKGFPLLGCIDDLPEVIDRERPDIIVVAMAVGRPAAFTHLLMQAEAGYTVIEISEFFEHAFGRVPVRNLERAWFMAALHLYQRRYSQAAKRCFDIAIAGALGLFALPIFPILVCLVRTTRGPVMVRQQRLGEHGKSFTMYKLRTMRFDAETPGEAVWSSHRDPRVTSIGKIMRTWRLDELPQLWNVFRGDMSIVGPRPERPEFLAQLEETVPFWNRRHLVRPGITGWAQVRRGYTSDIEGHAQKLSYDLWYLRHRSLIVDFAILLQTFAVLVKGGVPKPMFVPTQERPAEQRSGAHGPVALDVVRPSQVRDPEPVAGQSPRT